MKTIHLHRACPVCGNTRGERLRTIHMCLPEGNPLPPQYDVAACMECGFTFADTPATQETYNEYYTHHNMYSESAALKKTDVSSRPAFAHMLGLIRGKLPPDAAILDVGCGSGDFLSYLYEHGCRRLCGLDPSPASIACLESRYAGGVEAQ